MKGYAERVRAGVITLRDAWTERAALLAYDAAERSNGTADWREVARTLANALRKGGEA